MKTPFKDIFTKLTESNPGFTPCRLEPAKLMPLSSPEGLSKKLRSLIISEGEKHLDYEFEPLPMTLFMSFFREGNRVNYENIYFRKRAALNSLVLAEYIERKGRFTDSIINGIFSLCEESGWQLPAHNSYYRDTPGELLPDSERPVLDLFACETGAQLAMIKYLLADSLNTVHPFICKRIDAELQKRIFTPYLTFHFWWMGNGDEHMCNWTVWCIQNVLIAYYLSDAPINSRDESLAVMEKSCYGIDMFLKDYGEDGCCEEGAQYYRHAGLCLFNAMEVLNFVSNNAFCTMYKDNKVRNIAEYIEKVHVRDKYYFNFADCSPVAGRAGVREYLFGKRIGSDRLVSFAASDFAASDNDTRLTVNEINLFYRYQNLYTCDEILSLPQTDAASDSCTDSVYYKSIGLFIRKAPLFDTAVKAGDNDDSHNHNDTGSIIVYKNGIPLLIDVGVGTYTRQTFSPERYKLWPMQSAYHNLPTINGIMQKDGERYCATDISLSEKLDFISMNIVQAYPEEAGASAYIRKVDLSDNNAVIISDHVEYTGEYGSNTVLSLMTYEKPDICGNDIRLGELSVITCEGASDINFEEIPITDARLMTAWTGSVHRLLLTLDGTDLRLVIK